MPSRDGLREQKYETKNMKVLKIITYCEDWFTDELGGVDLVDVAVVGHYGGRDSKVIFAVWVESFQLVILFVFIFLASFCHFRCVDNCIVDSACTIRITFDSYYLTP